MPHVEVWAPLVGLGDEAASFGRALGRAAPGEVRERIAELAATPHPSPVFAASLLAARFAFAVRSADDPEGCERMGREAAGALRAVGQVRSATLVEAELAATLASRRERVADAALLASSLEAAETDPALAAAVWRARGVVARARSELGPSLRCLERARALGEEAGDVAEIVRVDNTLGTSYAVLGVADLAREALERARELAEVGGLDASAAVAAGQLAVLALDAGRHELAVRHLQAQHGLAQRLGDVHGLARSLALLVEAHALAGQPAESRDAARAARSLYARAPTAWTRQQAVLATLYESEAALAAGDIEGADALLASCADERASDAPEWRLARARSSFSSLARAARAGASVAPSIDESFAALRRSPRPAWVERLVSAAASFAGARGAGDLAASLALRATAVAEARAAAAVGLAALRTYAPDLAVARAAARGRALVLRARLALAPVDAFDAHCLVLVSDGAPGSVARLLDRFEAGGEGGAYVALGDDALVDVEGTTVVVVTPEAAGVSRAIEAVRGTEGLAGLGRASGNVCVRVDAVAGLVLSGVALESARNFARACV